MADEIVWPLRGVSKDPGNFIKLGTDGQVMTAQADLDARYVEVTGDTMTGPLTVKPTVAATSPAGHVQVVGDNIAPSMSIQSYTANGQIRFARADGTAAAPTGVGAGATIGLINCVGLRPDGTYANAGSLRCLAESAATNGASVTGRWNIAALDAGGEVNLISATASVLSVSQRDGRTTTGSYVPLVIQPNLITVRSNDAGGTLGIVSASTGGFFVTQRDPRTPTGQYGAFFLQPAGCSMWTGGPTGTFQTGFQAQDDGQLVMRSPKSEFACTATGNVYVLSKDGSTNKNVFFYTPTNGNLSFQDCDHFTIGAVGSLTYGFEVNRTAIFRQGLDVTGNITASGTSHSFANGSIPSPAVIGNIPRTIAATGSAGISGQMVWDDNFIYLRTTGGWKKVALTAI